MVNPLPYDLEYEQLLDIKLQNISNEYNKRPGDLIYTAVAPNSFEIIQMLASLNNYRDSIFIDTAPREDLIKRAVERGYSPLPGTKAIRKGTFNIDVPLGSRFTIQNLIYVAKIRISLGIYDMECESIGEIGNLYNGQLIPINDIPNLQSAVLSDVIIPGQDEESTEAFRSRLKNSFQATSFAGNRAGYKEKVMALPGVGGVRVFRAQNGPGTVGLLIIDSQFKAPTPQLISQVQEAIDPLSQQGEGVGLAPIDHVVTVSGVTNETINVEFELAFAPGYDFAGLKPQIENAIADYFEELGREWSESVTKEQDETGLIVRLSQIEFRVLSIQGILDVTNTELNGNAANIALNVNKIPSLGTVINNG